MGSVAVGYSVALCLWQRQNTHLLQAKRRENAAMKKGDAVELRAKGLSEWIRGKVLIASENKYNGQSIAVACEHIPSFDGFLMHPEHGPVAVLFSTAGGKWSDVATNDEFEVREAA